MRNKRLLSVIAALVFFVPAVIIEKAFGIFWAYFPLYAASYVAAGWLVFIKTARNISRGIVFDENFLMVIASIGAFVLNLTFSSSVELNSPSGGEEMMDGVLVLILYQIGEYFQSLAVSRSRRGIKQLLSLRPDSATVLRGESELEVYPDEVEIGETIIIKPGERVALDGVILSGESYVDRSMISGESEPRYLSAGDEIESGCISKSGYLTVRTTREFGQSTVSRMLALVESAAERKAKQEGFITRFAKVYTPIVCAAALLVGIIPPLAMWLSSGANTWNDWAYSALCLLVISCPCALVISVPLTFFGGIGGAAKRNLLIKGSDCFSPLSHVSVAVFDKTGTLTEGVPAVKEVVSDNADRMLALAAAAESRFTHPIAQSIVREAKARGLSLAECSSAEDLSGKGIRAEVEGISVILGNELLMRECGISFKEADSPYTAVYVSADGEYLGCIICYDKIKADSKIAISALKKMGIKSYMLTGDRVRTAEAASEELGLDGFAAELLPEKKVEEVERLIASGEKVLFCGDGINDAPVIARADIGLAMGGLGSDAAIEASDVIVMNDSPISVPLGIRHAKKVLRVAMQNIIGSLAVKAVIMALSLTIVGFPLWIAILGDVGVCLVAIANAMRAMRAKGFSEKLTA